MTSTILVSAKIFGKNKPLLEDWHLTLPTHLTLRELLTEIVSAEVAAFRQRQEQRRLIRILSPAEISQGVAKGKIEMGGSEISQSLNAQDAIDNAIQAFQDGLYYVFINEEQADNLDSPISLHPHSQILFLRLTPLIGG